MTVSGNTSPENLRTCFVKVNIDCSVTKKKAAPPSKKRRPIIPLSTDEEDNSEADPSEPVETNTDRSISLTPPPIVGEEALQQAMAVINDHMKNSTSATTTTRSRTRQQTSNSTTSTTAVDPPLVPASDDLDDDFDLAAYQNSMNSDIAKQAAILYSRHEEKPAVESKIFLVLVGRRFDGETLPLEWSKPLGLKFSSTMQFTKLRDEFKKQRKYEKDVILVLKGMRLSYGSAKELGLKDQTLIGTNPLRVKLMSDVFSEYGYKMFLEREQEKANMKKNGAIELSSEEEEEPPPQPEMVTLHLQGPMGKYKFRLPNVCPSSCGRANLRPQP